MRILVTGATGLLGPHLCRRLVEDGHEVTILRRPTSNVTQLANLNLRHEVGDITNVEDVLRATSDQDAVIHAAAHTAYFGASAEEQNRVNIEGTGNVVRACRAQRNTRLLHVSSVATIGIPAGPRKPADENFVFNLEGSGLTYHISKRRAEEEVLEAKGLDAVVVNPALIWGSNGDTYRGNEVFEKILRYPVIPHGPGGQCIVHVSDVVDGIVRALEEGRAGERYILGGDNVSFGELNRTICRQLGLTRLLIPIPASAAEFGNRVKNVVRRILGAKPLPTYNRSFCYPFYSSAKAKAQLGYNPRPIGSLVQEAAAYVGRTISDAGRAEQSATG